MIIKKFLKKKEILEAYIHKDGEKEERDSYKILEARKQMEQ